MNEPLEIGFDDGSAFEDPAVIADLPDVYYYDEEN